MWWDGPRIIEEDLRDRNTVRWAKMAARARLRRGAINRAVSTRLDLAKLKGDLAGGVTSAVLTVPVSMGYGVLALLPLGVDPRKAARDLAPR